MNSIDDDNFRPRVTTTSTHSLLDTGGTINVLAGRVSVQMLIDSGASTNVIDKGTIPED